MLLLLCFSRKLLPGSWPDVDTKEDAEIKEKIPPVRGSKTKSAQKIIAPSVEEKLYIGRAQFQELQ